jgi:exodeoxyribonuclease VIII
MIDLETLSSRPNAVITSIGAVAFNPETSTIGGSFKVNVDPESGEKLGLHISAKTVVWWLQQSEQARMAMLSDPKPLPEALKLLNAWIRLNAGDDATVWGNGATFDNVVISSNYEAAGVYRPWRFKNDWCYRTVKGLYPEVRLERTGTHHDALDDAMTQTKHLIELYHKVRGRSPPRPPGPMEAWADNKV